MKRLFLSKVAMIGIASASVAALAGCGRQEADTASARAPTQPMSDNEVTSHEESMKDMPMHESSPSAASTEMQTHMTKGTIQSVDREAGTVKIAHEAVPSLSWPAMTMEFKLSNAQDSAGLKEGEQVEFHFTEESAGQYAITQISPQH